MLLFHHHTPEARFAGWSFVALTILFLAVLNFKPVVGLSGLGAVLILGALQVEANKDRIWETYVERYKHHKGEMEKPNRLYYRLNIYVAWPAVFVLGLIAIYAAYILA